MPNRYIRDGINSSEKVNQLDFSAEVFYRRLILEVDDFGLYSANLTILRSSLYPLKVDSVREEDVSKWLLACEKANLIKTYKVEGKPFLVLLNVTDRPRSKATKWPLPPQSIWVFLHPNVSTCLQMLADAIDSDSVTDSDTVSDRRLNSQKVFESLTVPNELLSAEFTEKLVTWVERRMGMGKKPKCGWQVFFQDQIDWLGKYTLPIATEILSNSIRNNWQGLFLPKTFNSDATRKPNSNTGTLNAKTKSTYSNIKERLR